LRGLLQLVCCWFLQHFPGWSHRTILKPLLLFLKPSHSAAAELDASISHLAHTSGQVWTTQRPSKGQDWMQKTLDACLHRCQSQESGHVHESVTQTCNDR
jgi:hypothetical protein